MPPPDFVYTNALRIPIPATSKQPARNAKTSLNLPSFSTQAVSQ